MNEHHRIDAASSNTRKVIEDAGRLLSTAEFMLVLPLCHAPGVPVTWRIAEAPPGS